LQGRFFRFFFFPFLFFVIAPSIGEERHPVLSCNKGIRAVLVSDFPLRPQLHEAVFLFFSPTRGRCFVFRCKRLAFFFLCDPLLRPLFVTVQVFGGTSVYGQVTNHPPPFFPIVLGNFPPFVSDVIAIPPSQEEISLRCRSFFFPPISGESWLVLPFVARSLSSYVLWRDICSLYDSRGHGGRILVRGRSENYVTIRSQFMVTRDRTAKG